MQIRENFSLRPYNTFGIDAYAKYFITFKSIESLTEILNDSMIRKAGSYFILGGGSNILFTKNFDGFVLKNEIEGIELDGQNEEYVYLKVGAGVNWHQFVMYCIEKNYAGVENLALIPGNVGASPMQNIGAYGVELKDVFHQLEAMHIQQKTCKMFTAEECSFGYRESVFKNKFKGQYIICNVTFRLSKQPQFNTSYGALKHELEKQNVTKLNICAIADAVMHIRRSKLPDHSELGNAGSFFKNPLLPINKFNELKIIFPSIPSYPVNDDFVKVPAGWLIESCGWKGYRNGDAGCYDKQALVLVNYGNATGSEILALSEEIIHSVKEKFDIELEREVNIV